MLILSSEDAPQAIKDVSFTVNPGTKVGITGRTGRLVNLSCRSNLMLIKYLAAKPPCSSVSLASLSTVVPS